MLNKPEQFIECNLVSINVTQFYFLIVCRLLEWRILIQTYFTSFTQRHRVWEFKERDDVIYLKPAWNWELPELYRTGMLACCLCWNM